MRTFLIQIYESLSVRLSYFYKYILKWFCIYFVHCCAFVTWAARRWPIVAEKCSSKRRDLCRLQYHLVVVKAEGHLQIKYLNLVVCAVAHSSRRQQQQIFECDSFHIASGCVCKWQNFRFAFGRFSVKVKSISPWTDSVSSLHLVLVFWL